MEKINVKSKSILGVDFLYKKTVLGLISKLDKGLLKLETPDGLIQEIGNGCSGVVCDIKITNEDFFKKCFLSGDIGFGESYCDGDWETSDLTKVIKWLILNIDNIGMVSGSNAKSNMMLNIFKVANKFEHFFNRNNHEGSLKNISYHYDLSNDFYKLMLDETMTYSCGIFKDHTTSLKDSQIEKYERLCQDLDLKEGEHVLEIGCGWGGFASYAVKNYKVRVTGLTISKEQYDYAVDRMKREGISSEVEILFKDYRDMTGEFDKIVSIEMIEAVGDEFLADYFEQIDRLLKKNGLVTIQAITSPDSRYQSFVKGVDFIQKHIFPGSLLPAVGAMNKYLSNTNLHMFNLRDIGLDYAITLRLWREKFVENWGKIEELGFDDYFFRKWNYYLCYCEAAFATRNISDVQVTFIKPNNTMVHIKEHHV